MQIRPSQIASRAIGFTSSPSLVPVLLGGAVVLGLFLLGLGGALMAGCSSGDTKATVVGGTGGIGAPGGGSAIGGMGGSGGTTVQVFEKANGWAAYHPAGNSAQTTGGASADAAHMYTVADRKQLILALYPDAIFSANGAFTSAAGPDATPKIIYVRGTIDLSANAAGVEQKEADFACPGYSFESYTAAYAPGVWNKQALVRGRPPALPVCPGTPEEARLCSSARQGSVVRVRVGSNTTIFGLAGDARLVKGSLVVGEFPPGLPPPVCDSSGMAGGGGGISLGAGGMAGGRGSAGAGGTAGGGGGSAATVGDVAMPFVDNVIIRNITFEDAFDYFPAWTPTDSYVTPPAVANPASLYPKCQATIDEAGDLGPHQCPGGRWNSEYDNISVANATHVWIDHCTFSDGAREDHLFPSVWQAPYVGHDYLVEHHDGLVDVTLASDFVTLSYNVFSNHDKTNLLGGSDTVSTALGWGALSVTLHHNYWQNAGQRLPRVRFGKVHSYDNYITGKLLPVVKTAADLSRPVADNPLTYAMGIGYLAKLYSENNVLEITSATGDPEPTESAAYFLWHKAAPTTGTTADVNEKTYFFDSGTTLNGKPTDLFAHAQAAAAAMVPPKPPLTSTEVVWKPSSSYDYQPHPASAVKADVLNHAGAGNL